MGFGFWKATTSKGGPRQKQIWILKCLQGGRARPLAACGVAHALLLSTGAAAANRPRVRATRPTPLERFVRRGTESGRWVAGHAAPCPRSSCSARCSTSACAPPPTGSFPQATVEPRCCCWRTTRSRGAAVTSCACPCGQRCRYHPRAREREWWTRAQVETSETDRERESGALRSRQPALSPT
jgi:hypothetical protein